MRTMTSVRRSWWIAILVFVVGLVSPSLAQDFLGARESLAGLAGVYIIVEVMGAAVEREGLSRSTLQTDVEVKLRQAGIRVLTKTEWVVAPGAPYLYLRVATVRAGELSFYTVAILLPFTKTFYLPGRPPELSAPLRGEPNGSALWGTKEFSWVRENVRDKVDEFINAYLAANPRR